jgi:hypothetical protein
MEPTIPDFDPAEVPEHVVVLCLACAQYVHAATGVALDFTPDTLPLLDHYLQGVRDAKGNVKELVATAAGAYFGELVRRMYPSRWHAPDEAFDAWRVEFSRCFLHFNPVGFAREAIEGHDVGGGYGFGVNGDDVPALEAGLAAYGDVPTDDYYLLSTRIEVLGPVVDRLLANNLARGAEELEYGPAVYRVALDEGANKPS